MKKKTEEIIKDIPKINTKNFFQATGRRKEAVARVRLYLKGSGEIIVNDLPAEKYFPGLVADQLLKQIFKSTGTENRFNVNVKVSGSGKMGQLIAVLHGIARALMLVDSEKYKLILRRNGYLTRDPRTRERRKVGKGGKARRQKQSPKR